MWQKDNDREFKKELGNGIFNGELGRIERINKEEKTVTVRFDDGKYAMYENTDLDQLEHAYSITVHKSQGMTLDAAEMDLSKVFEPGQGYVALSRLKSLESLKLLGLNESGLNAHPLVARGDDYFWNQSELLVEQYGTRTDDIWDELHAHFVELVGGIYTKDITEKSKVMLSDYTYKGKTSKK